MSLALHLGMPVDEMLQSMTQAEFGRWALYAKRNALPFARLELMLAQICMLIARTMGGVKNANVGDFLPQRPDDEPKDNETHIEQMKRAFNFRPRQKLKVV